MHSSEAVANALQEPANTSAGFLSPAAVPLAWQTASVTPGKAIQKLNLSSNVWSRHPGGIYRSAALPAVFHSNGASSHSPRVLLGCLLLEDGGKFALTGQKR